MENDALGRILVRKRARDDSDEEEEKEEDGRRVRPRFNLPPRAVTRKRGREEEERETDDDDDDDDDRMEIVDKEVDDRAVRRVCARFGLGPYDRGNATPAPTPTTATPIDLLHPLAPLVAVIAPPPRRPTSAEINDFFKPLATKSSSSSSSNIIDADLIRHMMRVMRIDEAPNTPSADVEELIRHGEALGFAALAEAAALDDDDVPLRKRLCRFIREAQDVIVIDLVRAERQWSPHHMATMSDDALCDGVQTALANRIGARETLYTAFQQDLTAAERFLVALGNVDANARRFVAASLVAADPALLPVLRDALLATARVADSGAITFAHMGWTQAWGLARALTTQPLIDAAARVVPGDAVAAGAKDAIGRLAALCVVMVPSATERIHIPYMPAAEMAALERQADAAASLEVDAIDAGRSVSAIAGTLRGALAAFGRDRAALFFFAACAVHCHDGVKDDYWAAHLAIMALVDPGLLPRPRVAAQCVSNPSALTAALMLLAGRGQHWTNIPASVLHMMLLFPDDNSVLVTAAGWGRDEPGAVEPALLVRRVHRAPSLGITRNARQRRLLLDIVLQKDALAALPTGADIGALMAASPSALDLVCNLRAVRARAEPTLVLSSVLEARLLRLLNTPEETDSLDAAALYTALLLLSQILPAAAAADIARLVAKVYIGMPWVSTARRSFRTLLHLIGECSRRFTTHLAIVDAKTLIVEQKIAPLALLAYFYDRAVPAFSWALANALALVPGEVDRVYEAYALYSTRVQFTAFDVLRLAERSHEYRKIPNDTYADLMMAARLTAATLVVTKDPRSLISLLVGDVGDVSTHDTVLVSDLLQMTLRKLAAPPTSMALGAVRVNVMEGLIWRFNAYTSLRQRLQLFPSVLSTLSAGSATDGSTDMLVAAAARVFRQLVGGMGPRAFPAFLAEVAASRNVRQATFFFGRLADAVGTLVARPSRLATSVDTALADIVLFLEGRNGRPDALYKMAQRLPEETSGDVRRVIQLYANAAF